VTWLFVISLTAALSRSVFAGNFIKRYNTLLYLIAMIISGSVITLSLTESDFYYNACAFCLNTIALIETGFASTAIFILVMFTGTVNRRVFWGAELYKTRAEQAIIASILALPHSIIQLVNCYNAFSMQLPKKITIPPNTIVVIISGIAALIIMLPLFITSFVNIRKKMKSTQWKKIQKWSYLFYFLLYIHLAFTAISYHETDYYKLLLYSSIFSIYTVLRIKRNINKCIRESANET